MDTQEQNPELLDFFRALADENRLKIVGLLAQKPSSVSDLAKALGLSVSTTSNHLSSLAYAGLVKAQPDGHYFIYSLQMETIRNMAKHLLQEENLPRLSEGQGEDAFERKVLNTFLNREGRIKVFPAQEKKFLVLCATRSKPLSRAGATPKKKSTRSSWDSTPIPLPSVAASSSTR